MCVCVREREREGVRWCVCVCVAPKCSISFEKENFILAFDRKNVDKAFFK